MNSTCSGERLPGDADGNKDQDWLVAEREILARHGSHEQHTA